jgi:uncharacterized protein (DUF169 family)
LIESVGATVETKKGHAVKKQLIDSFLVKWRTYFGEAELPIVYYYADDITDDEPRGSAEGHRCIICNLSRAREGHTYVYDAKTPGCAGAKRYTGYSKKLRANFEYFLSCGIEGKLEGERYKKSPELVKELMKTQPPFEAPGKYLVFKRWDALTERDEPLVVIFFADPDVLAGLFTLANYDRADRFGVIAPMGSGCSSIVYHPLFEVASERPQCVLGMFDVSARPCVPANTLTFAVPIRRFQQMVDNMDESFLITDSWAQVQSRIRKKLPEK